MQNYSSFHYCSYSVSQCPDGFADGLCALRRGGETEWRFVLGEWTSKSISLFINVAIVSECPDGFYWRVVRSVWWRTSVETCSRWVNMQIYSSFHYCSYCFPISWWLCWRAVLWRITVEICSRWVSEHANRCLFSLYCSYCVPMSWWLYWRLGRSVRWRTSVETCSRWVNMQIYTSFHYCSYCVPISWWLCWRAVLWRTTVEICYRWVNMEIFFSFHYCSYCVLMALLTDCALCVLENQHGDLF